jgi:uncharacterized protein (TIGR02996 family)
MTDHDALLRAICDSPDDDTPRLIYADYLEDTGEADRAAFVRAQVELARTPDWEPFAVMCRTRQREWSEQGQPFLHTLPLLGPDVTWHAEPFRRGLGWRVHVASLRGWSAIAPRLYESAPIGELHLKAAATLDDWHEFADGDWVRWFRVIHLEGGSPVEPIRALCSNLAACGMTDIHFHNASSPGLPELVEDLLATPLGRGLRGLHFSVAYQPVVPLMDVLCASKLRLRRLSFRNMKLNSVQVERLLQSTIASELEELDLSEDRLRDRGEWEEPWPGDPEWISQLPATLRRLRIANASLVHGDFQIFGEEPFLPALRSLDMERNYSLGRADDFFDYRTVGGLRMLSCRACQFGPETWRRLVQSRVWMNAVCLDLRGNPVGSAAVRRLLDAPPSANLVSLRIEEPADAPAAEELRAKFGERIVFAEKAGE